MKKTLLLLFVCLLASLSIKAQSERIIVYGIDFSQVRVCGADESVEKFAGAFNGINNLLITEPEKYDFSRMFKKRVVVDIEPMINKLSTSDFSDFFVYSPSIEDIDISSIIEGYDISQSEGVGAVLIARLLDKSAEKAVYELVVFDIETRKIVHQRQVTGEAGGFGLRNYWACSVYNVIKNVRIRIAQ